METLLEKISEAKLVELARAEYSANLFEAELRIIHDSVRAGPAKPHAGDRPEARHVRGDFLRWLVNDARARPLIYKDGLLVVGATVDGEVDLDSSHIPYDLTFNNCVFRGDVHFVWAETRSVRLINSKCNGNISFQSATIGGDLDMVDGFQSEGSITMYGTRVSGDLSMKEAKLVGKDKELSLNLADIQGAVYFEDLSCAGSLWMLNTKIGYELLATGAKFGSTVSMTGVSVQGDLILSGIQSNLKTRTDNQSLASVELEHAKVGGSIYLNGACLQCEPKSLSMGNATVAGNVYLMANFQAAGSVSLQQVVIKQNLIVNEAELAELDCSNAQIGGDLTWAGIHHREKTKLTLVRTRVNRLQDVKKSWPSKRNLRVTGFVYEQISLGVPPDVPDLLGQTSWRSPGATPDDRLEWLKLQSDEDLRVSQPWMQLAKFLQANGNPAGSRKVLYAMERTQAKDDGTVSRGLSFFYDLVDENPLRVVFPIGLFWIFGTVIFWRARRMKAMSPTEKDAYEHFSRNGNQPPNYVPFNAVIYALENVLPVVKLGQDDTWAANPETKPASLEGWRRFLPRMSYNWLSLLRWLLILLGWVLALILAGAIADRFKS